MRTHTHRLDVRLDDKEYRKLKKLAEKTHFSQSQIIRKMIDGQLLIEYPPVDYWSAYKELENCRWQLANAAQFNSQCKNCEACQAALDECKQTWRLHRSTFFDPDFFKPVNINDERNANEKR